MGLSPEEAEPYLRLIMEEQFGSGAARVGVLLSCDRLQQAMQLRSGNCRCWSRAGPARRETRAEERKESNLKYIFGSGTGVQLRSANIQFSVNKL